MSDQNREAPAGIPAFRDPTDLANAVISTLQVPPEPTVVAVTYSNSRNGAAEVQAYAKIAGRNWTFYVKTLAVSIGRSTDPASQVNTSPPTYTHIDLGPAKVVSRHHASITYNAQLRCWELQVLGRNGARVDGVKVAVGIQGAVPLHSGAILDVGGTQMMFILPDTPPSIAPKFLSSCLAKLNNEITESHKRQKLMDSSHSISSFQMFEKGAVSAVSLQNNLDQDLSREDSKDIKPPYSYATMITQAILSNPDGVMSLAEIYAWISSRYAYYKYSKTGWQNSIRHNLSLNKAFEKVPRRPNEPGKGMKWRISEAYRNDFLNKVNSGTLSKSRRGSSVSRTLQIHLATHQKLPEAKNYGNISTKSDDANGENSADSAQDHQDPQQPPIKSEGSMSNSKNMKSEQIVPQQQALQPMNPGQVPQVPQGYLPLPPKTSQDFHMPYTTSGFIPRGTYPPNQHQDLREMQNYQHMQPHTQSRELASPMKHTSMDAQSMAQNHPQNVGPHVNGEGYVPGINIFKPVPTSDPKQDVQFAPKLEQASTENGRASHSNSSHLPNTSESILHQSTAPSTSNNSDIGIHFTSPKKVVPPEAFTPERGSKTMNPGARMGPHNNIGQSSPAFWNFVQFSTPNGQSPGRKNSDEDNGSESPSIKKGGDKTAVALHNETPHK